MPREPVDPAREAEEVERRAPPDAGKDPVRGNWTLPNFFSALRLAGSPFLVVIALADSREYFLWLFVVLLMTDWIDGKLAVLLHQRTTLGARLDSIADATFYASTLFATLWLEWDLVRSTMLWIGLALASYAVNTTTALVRYRRLPSYHTRLAKTSWLLMGIAVIALFAKDSTWPLMVGLVAVIVTNLEQTIITCMRREWRADIASIFHALPDRRDRSC